MGFVGSVQAAKVRDGLGGLNVDYWIKGMTLGESQSDETAGGKYVWLGGREDCVVLAET